MNKFKIFLCLSALFIGSTSLAMNYNKQANELCDAAMDVWNQRLELCKAAENGNLEQAKALLAAGIPVDVRDSSGVTPLMLAAYIGHIDASKSQNLCELFIANNAYINAKDLLGRTPLHWAVVLGTKNVCKLLILHNANLDEKNVYGFSPFRQAVHSNGTKARERTFIIDVLVNIIKLRAIILLGLKKFHKAACMEPHDINVIRCIVRHLCDQEKQKLYGLIDTVRNPIDKKMVLDYAKEQLKIDPQKT